MSIIPEYGEQSRSSTTTTIRKARNTKLNTKQQQVVYHILEAIATAIIYDTIMVRTARVKESIIKLANKNATIFMPQGCCFPLHIYLSFGHSFSPFGST